MILCKLKLGQGVDVDRALAGNYIIPMQIMSCSVTMCRKISKLSHSVRKGKERAIYS